MSRSVCFLFAMSLCSTPLWCQVEPSASGGPGAANDDSYMSMPAPVSGSFYRSILGAHRENYLSAGVGTSASYSDNVLVSASGKPVSRRELLHLPDHSAANEYRTDQRWIELQRGIYIL